MLRDGEEVMSEGKTFDIQYTSVRKSTTSNSSKSDGRNRQTIGGRRPKFVKLNYDSNMQFYA